MGRVGLVRTLKGVIIFLAVMAAVCYLVIFPSGSRRRAGCTIWSGL